MIAWRVARLLAAALAAATVLPGVAGAQTTVNEEAELFVTSPAAQAGASVSISGNTAVVSAPHASGDIGQVDVYTRTPGTHNWAHQATITATGANAGAAGDLFGASVSIDESTGDLAVGAPGRNSSAGAAYVYHGSAASWAQAAYLTRPSGVAGDKFGNSVSIEAHTVIVGAPYATLNGKVAVGAAYGFTYNSGAAAWQLQSSLAVSTGPAKSGDHIGWSVSLSGNTAAIGAPDDDHGKAKANAGSVYIFVRTNGRWRKTQYLNPSATIGNRMGASVSLSGNTAVFGVNGPQANGGKGYAYVYTRSGTSFALTTTLTPSGAAAGDCFGTSVAASGIWVVVGAPQLGTGCDGSSAATGKGYAYVYKLVSGSYQEFDHLVPLASDYISGVNFGTGVAMDAGRAIVGAPLTVPTGTSAGNGSAYPFLVAESAIVTATITSPTPPTQPVSPPGKAYAGQNYTVNFAVVPEIGTDVPTGFVNVDDTFGGGCADTLTTPSVQLDNTGHGQCVMNSDIAGQIPITVRYLGDTLFGSVSANPAPQEIILQVPTKTTLGFAPSTSTLVGQTVTANMSVSANPPVGVTLNGAAPVGSLTASDSVGGHPTCNIADSSVANSCQLAPNFGQPGTYNFAASYVSIADVPSTYGYAPCALTDPCAGLASHTVDKASTTTSLSQDINPSTIGQVVTFTSNVTVVAPGSSSPTPPSGTVAVSDGAGDSCVITLPATSCQITFTGAGTTHFTATYGGDTNFFGSASGSVDHFTKANTTVTITPTPTNPPGSVVGQSVTFKVKVTQIGSVLAATPGGTVTLTAAGGSPGSCTISLSAGAGSCPVTFNAVAGSLVAATYNGDANFNTSNSQITYAVGKANTTLILTQSSATTAFNQSVTFTATLASSGTVVPTGTVTFFDGASSIGTGSVNGSGVATLSTSTLALGSHNIKASYGGDTKFTSGANATVVHNVVAAGVDIATTTLSQDLPTSVVGQQVTFTATVTPTTGVTPTPTGTVTVTAGSFTCNVTLAAGTGNTATGTCKITFTKHGTVSATGGYNGDVLYSPATSSGISHTTNAANTTTSFVQNFNPSVVGQSVTFTVTVKPVAPGAGAPTGSVTVSAGGGLNCTASLNAGVNQSGASCALTFAAAGPSTITVTYNNIDGDFHTSNTSAGHITNATAKASSVTTLSQSADPTLTGSPVTLFVTVNHAGVSGTTPTGHVLITNDVDNTITCNITLNASGQGNCQVTFTAVGSSNTLASYQGDATYNGSSDLLAHETDAAAAFDLMFTKQPPGVTPPFYVGSRLGDVEVSVVNKGTSTVRTSDQTTQVTLSITACGAPVTFGPVQVVNGVATFTGVGPIFYTAATGLKLDANSSPAYTPAQSTAFDVTGPNPDMKFANGFDSCRL